MAKKTVLRCRLLRQARADARRLQRSRSMAAARSPTTAASRAPCRRSRRILEGGGSLMLMSHLGRPDGAPRSQVLARARCQTTGRAARIKTSSSRPIASAPRSSRWPTKLTDGQCMVLENLRFHAAETIKDKKAKDDASLRKQKDEFAARRLPVSRTCVRQRRVRHLPPRQRQHVHRAAA
jgi:hypothetical protein